MKDYLELLDCSERILRDDKKSAIHDHLPDILQRLDMDAKQFTYFTQNFEHPFSDYYYLLKVKLAVLCETA